MFTTCFRSCVPYHRGTTNMCQCHFIVNYPRQRRIHLDLPISTTDDCAENTENSRFRNDSGCFNCGIRVRGQSVGTVVIDDSHAMPSQ